MKELLTGNPIQKYYLNIHWYHGDTTV